LLFALERLDLIANFEIIIYIIIICTSLHYQSKLRVMGSKFDILIVLRYNTQVLLSKGGNLYDEKYEK
jgi:hypothetical protein